MFLRHHNANGLRFSVSPPECPPAREYLARQCFWERFNFSEASIKRENLNRITTRTSLNDIIDIEQDDIVGEVVGQQVYDLLIANGYYTSPDKISVMTAELVDNFAQHAEKRLAAMTLQYYPRIGTLKLSIADCGVGIRASLSKNPKHKWLENQPHHRCAVEALKPGVSRKHEGGIGFLDILDGVEELGGQFILATGDEYITVRKKKISFAPMHFDLPGVQIEFQLPIGRRFA